MFLTTIADAHDDVMQFKNFLRYWPFVRESTGDR